MFRVSKDSPIYYVTSVTHNRLPIFKTPRLSELLCEALNEARQSAQLLLLAYVIIPDHFHALVGSGRKPSEVLRYLNGIAAHRIIGFLREFGFESSLQKLRHASVAREHKYSLWDHHPNVKLITTENGLMVKANYIHLNPVRARLVERAEDYRFSSVRCCSADLWRKNPSLLISIKSPGMQREA